MKIVGELIQYLLRIEIYYVVSMFKLFMFV